jgi:hypothetical protein
MTEGFLMRLRASSKGQPMPTKPQLILDIECYPDYFLVAFMNVATKNVRFFERHAEELLDTATLRRILNTYEIITFNGTGYDLPMLSFAMTGVDNAALKHASDAIINNNLKPWVFEKQFNVAPLSADHIDLMDVAPGTGSLKLYGGRLHFRTLQDLPLEPGASIAPEQRPAIREYCQNDLHTTAALLHALTPQIDLRRAMSAEYTQDLRSKSDAQIAEAVIRQQVTRIMGFDIGKPEPDFDAVFRYQKPDFIAFQTPALQSLLNTILNAEFHLNAVGKVQEPDALRTEISIGNATYRLGIGGLHSTEKSAAHIADEHHLIIDRDVVSYYPSIILNCGLYPRQMGSAFLTAYQAIVQRRLTAKRNGNSIVANALKITINGSFGKFGNRYSRLFSPDLLIQTTVTGQLALLMLIETLELQGIAVVSANTDGIVIKCPVSKAALLDDLVFAWECATGFDTEETRYTALYSRDVNNYIAIKPDGCKTKGVYAPAGIHKNPDGQIAIDAAINYLRHGTPIGDTIRACNDVRHFVKVRTVRGGALYRDQFLGRVVRWYYSVGTTGAIHYRVNGYKVPDTDGATPLQTLPDQFPSNVDVDRYIADAHAILTEIGAM